jgi:hypothetical protein
MAFDQPFFTLLPGPPLGMADPCYSKWITANRLAWERASVCRLYGNDSKQCEDARERFYEAARQYAFCMDDVWGKDEF